MFYEERAEERGEVAPGTKMGVRMWGTGEQWRLEEGRGAVCGQERLVRTKVDTHLGQLGQPHKPVCYCHLAPFTL